MTDARDLRRSRGGGSEKVRPFLLLHGQLCISSALQFASAPYSRLRLIAFLSNYLCLALFMTPLFLSVFLGFN